MAPYFTKDEQKILKSILNEMDKSSEVLEFKDWANVHFSRQERYNAYKNTKTWEAFFSAGGKMEDVLSDLKFDFLKISTENMNQSKVYVSVINDAIDRLNEENTQKELVKNKRKRDKDETKRLLLEDKAAAVTAIKAVRDSEKANIKAYANSLHEAMKIKKESEKQAKKSEKEAEKKAKKAEKELKKAEKEAKKAEKEAKKAEKEAKKAEKEAKKVESDDDHGDNDSQEEETYCEANLKKMKVGELKNLLSQKNFDTKGKKNELVQRLLAV